MLWHDLFCQVRLSTSMWPHALNKSLGAFSIICILVRRNILQGHWGLILIIISSIYTDIAWLQCADILTNPAHVQQHRNYFFLSILLIMALTSTGAEAAATLAFSSSSFCQRIMGWMPGLRFWAFCSSWAGLRERGHMYYKASLILTLNSVQVFPAIIRLIL